MPGSWGRLVLRTAMGMPASIAGRDGLLVQHARAHIGELAHLRIGDAADGLRVLHDARVGREEARHVRPVLVQVGVERLREDGARDVAAAPVEEQDAALARGAVEARHHKAPGDAALLDELVRAPHGERAVVMEGDHIGRVEKRQPQVLGHKLGGKVLAAADELLGGESARLGLLGKRGKLVTDGIGETELVGNSEVARADIGQQVVARERDSARGRRPSRAGR